MKIIQPADAISKALKRTTINKADIENFRTCLSVYLANVDASVREGKDGRIPNKASRKLSSYRVTPTAFASVCLMKPFMVVPVCCAILAMRL